MAENDNLGEKSDTGYKVGPGHPPLETRFQPGHEPLPGVGRPKGSNYKQRFKDLLEKYSTYKAPDQIVKTLKTALPDLPDNVSIEEAEAFVAHLSALQGQSWAYDRIHDKPAQSTDITSKGNEIKQNIYNVIDTKQKELLEKAHNSADDI